MLLSVLLIGLTLHDGLPAAHAFIPQHLNRPVTRYRGAAVTSSKNSNAQVSASLSNASAKPNGEESSQKKLSRPERKARERDLKEARQSPGNRGNRKHNFAERRKFLTRDQPGEEPFELHSNVVSILTQESTADDVLRSIKRAQNLHDVHDIRHIENFLLQEVDEGFAYGYRGSLLARLAVAALHMKEHDLARRAIEERRKAHRSAMLPMESAAIIRGLLRVHNVSQAMDILSSELSLPLEETATDSLEAKDKLKHRALALSSIASRHFFEGEPSMAVLACGKLTEMGPIIRLSGLTSADFQMPWTRIIQGAMQCESGRRDGSVTPCMPDLELPCNLVYSVLNAMMTFPSDNNDDTYEALSNALVRRTVFITGAVDIAGCPEADRGEAVFIGRSNVGKSSLVNMVTNRKSLAYTSKRPGKTQQFNYFAVNDKPEREREIKYGDEVLGESDPDSFYIVDLPGFGFAKVPQSQRQAWSDFFVEFLVKRKTLRVLFHLVDARHGAIDEDVRIMRQVGQTLPKQVKYVVVLTKSDKNVKSASTKNPGKVSRSVLQKLRQTMKDNNVGNAPVLLTSAETKLGRDNMWRYLRFAAEAK